MVITILILLILMATLYHFSALTLNSRRGHHEVVRGRVTFSLGRRDRAPGGASFYER